MSYQHIEVTPISGACGAVVGGIDISEDLDEQRLGEGKRAFNENLVIFFRDQNLTHLEKPPIDSILYALEVPSAGGDTPCSPTSTWPKRNCPTA